MKYTPEVEFEEDGPTQVERVSELLKKSTRRRLGVPAPRRRAAEAEFPRGPNDQPRVGRAGPGSRPSRPR
jgi:hypothetical protein